MRFNQGLFDAHVHTHGGFGADAYLEQVALHLSASGLDGENLICVRHGRAGCMTDCDALLAKAMMPGRLTVYGNAANHTEGFDCTPEGFREQVRQMMESGQDGLKMADGETRGGPLDDPQFDLTFEMLAREGYPLLYHVGQSTELPPRRALDPANNKPGRKGWDPERNKKEQREIDNMLTRHPGVKIVLPHFYYHGAEPEALASFLDRHPNACVDVTPVTEQYLIVSGKRREWIQLFGDYPDRFLLGTDNVTSLDPTVTLDVQRHFFESDEEFFVPAWGFTLHGLGLPADLLKKIYRENVKKVCPPRPIVPKKAAEYCENLYEQVKDFEELPANAKEEILDIARRFRAMG